MRMSTTIFAAGVSVRGLQFGSLVGLLPHSLPPLCPCCPACPASNRRGARARLVSHPFDLARSQAAERQSQLFHFDFPEPARQSWRCPALSRPLLSIKCGAWSESSHVRSNLQTEQRLKVPLGA